MHRTHEDVYVAIRDAINDCGFIGTPDGREIHFHRNSIVNADFDRPTRAPRYPGGEGLPMAPDVPGRNEWCKNP